MSEILEEKKKLIAEIKHKISELEKINEDIWTSTKVAAINSMAIAKHYETICKLLQ